MQWNEIRAHFPDQWLVVETIGGCTRPNGKRDFPDILPIESCPDGLAAFRAYRMLHAQHPERELYYVHTSRVELDVTEESWLGVRIPRAA